MKIFVKVLFAALAVISIHGVRFFVHFTLSILKTSD